MSWYTDITDIKTFKQIKIIALCIESYHLSINEQLKKHHDEKYRNNKCTMYKNALYVFRSEVLRFGRTLRIYKLSLVLN